MESCCLGCNKLEFVPTNLSHKDVNFLTNLNNSDIILPIENARGTKKFGHNMFAPLIDLNGVTFFGRRSAASTVDLVKMLVESTKRTWPLYVIALALAICAGSIVWVLVRILPIQSPAPQLNNGNNRTMCEIYS